MLQEEEKQQVISFFLKLVCIGSDTSNMAIWRTTDRNGRMRTHQRVVLAFQMVK
jgi:hypothetical protein